VSARIPTLGHLPHRQPDPDIRRRRGAVYNLRRSRGAVYNLHAHLIFVTTYRRAVFTDAMLTFCEHPTRSVCADLDAELREFNADTDHVHLRAHYPPSLALSVLVNRLKGVSSRRLRQQYPTEIGKYLWGAHVWSPSDVAASCGRRSADCHQALHRTAATARLKRPAPRAQERDRPPPGRERPGSRRRRSGEPRLRVLNCVDVQSNPATSSLSQHGGPIRAERGADHLRDAVERIDPVH
jgi:putative transposase